MRKMYAWMLSGCKCIYLSDEHHLACIFWENIIHVHGRCYYHKNIDELKVMSLRFKNAIFDGAKITGLIKSFLDFKSEYFLIVFEL